MGKVGIPTVLERHAGEGRVIEGGIVSEMVVSQRLLIGTEDCVVQMIEAVELCSVPRC